MLIILCICWLQGLKMLLWTSNLVCCIKMIWISPQALALLRTSPVFLNRSTHTHSAQEQAWIQLQKCCENNRGKQMKRYSPFTLPTQWEKCWAHGNVLALRREQEELIIIPKLSQKLSMCCSTAWKLLTDRCSCHLTLDIPSWHLHVQSLKREAVPKVDSLYHPPGASFFPSGHPGS